MMAIFRSTRHHYMAGLSIFLVVATLMSGLAGCGSRPAVNAIEIRDWYDLQAIGNNMSANYVLENDLDATTDGWEELASPTANGGKGWQPITGIGQSQPAYFAGVFDGQGHEIKDLFINRPDGYRVGLFSFINLWGVIRNIGVVNADVTGGERVGGLVGQVATGTVGNSYSRGTVSGGQYIGGLVGGIWEQGTVSNCYFIGSVDGDADVGGLVGVNSDGTVSNSYSAGDAGLVGHNSGGTVSNSFWDIYNGGSLWAWSDGGTGKTTAEMKDITTFSDTEEEGLDEPWDIIATAYGETDSACIWNIVDDGTYPFLSWEQPREIQGIRDWYDLYSVRDNLGGSYALMNDLDSTTAGYDELAGSSANEGMGWEPVGTYESLVDYSNGFNGVLDGQGHEIRDLFLNRPEEFVTGLFGLVTGGMIRDIGLVEAAVTGNRTVGSLVGENWGGTVSDSHFTGSVSGYLYTGGLVGENWDGTVSNSYSTGSVSGYLYTGGLVGENWDGTVTQSYSTSSVSGYLYTGGLVGENWDGTVTQSYSTSSVSGNSSIGGLVGENWDGAVARSYSTGSVTGNRYVGGLVGENWDGTVTQSYSTSSVSGNSSIGGLVGYSSGNVTESYAAGTVTGNIYIGGLLGYNAGSFFSVDDWPTVSNSYAIGSVTGVNYTGGLVGYDYFGIVTNSFWDTETSGQATSDGGTGKTTSEMQDVTTFSGATWPIIAVASPSTRDTDYTWNIVDDETYPFLSWEPVA